MRGNAVRSFMALELLLCVGLALACGGSPETPLPVNAPIEAGVPRKYQDHTYAIAVDVEEGCEIHWYSVGEQATEVGWIGPLPYQCSDPNLSVDVVGKRLLVQEKIAPSDYLVDLIDGSFVEVSKTTVDGHPLENHFAEGSPTLAKGTLIGVDSESLAAPGGKWLFAGQEIDAVPAPMGDPTLCRYYRWEFGAFVFDEAKAWSGRAGPPIPCWQQGWEEAGWNDEWQDEQVESPNAVGTALQYPTATLYGSSDAPPVVQAKLRGAAPGHVWQLIEAKEGQFAVPISGAAREVRTPVWRQSGGKWDPISGYDDIDKKVYLLADGDRLVLCRPDRGKFDVVGVDGRVLWSPQECPARWTDLPIPKAPAKQVDSKAAASQWIVGTPVAEGCRVSVMEFIRGRSVEMEQVLVFGACGAVGATKDGSARWIVGDNQLFQWARGQTGIQPLGRLDGLEQPMFDVEAIGSDTAGNPVLWAEFIAPNAADSQCWTLSWSDGNWDRRDFPRGAQGCISTLINEGKLSSSYLEFEREVEAGWEKTGRVRVEKVEDLTQWGRTKVLQQSSWKDGPALFSKGVVRQSGDHLAVCDLGTESNPGAILDLTTGNWVWSGRCPVPIGDGK